MNGKSWKLQSQRLSWIMNRNVISEIPQNTGSNTFMDEKVLNTFMDKKVREAVKFVRKFFVILNLDIQSIHTRKFLTTISKNYFLKVQYLNFEVNKNE